MPTRPYPTGGVGPFAKSITACGGPLQEPGPGRERAEHGRDDDRAQA